MLSIKLERWHLTPQCLKKYFKVNNVTENINFSCVYFYPKNNAKDSFNIASTAARK